jgi:cysteine desulfurase / selenocysteine lyase
MRREDFPLLRRQGPSGKPLVYLDSAAMSLKPQGVIDAVANALALHTANVHRSVHLLGDEATALYEGARAKIARFIGAEAHEIVFVRNATEALNLVARCWTRRGRLVTTLAEHHSNLLPWDGARAGHVTRLPPLPDGSLDEVALDRELERGDVALVSLTHLSNVTGIMLDAARIAERVHAASALLVLDAAQSVPHLPVDVHSLDCDFLAFSGHKMCAPSGIGVLFGRAELLAEMSWHLRGGATVEEVHADRVVPKPPPWRFEAGTPPIEAAAGLGAAVDYLEEVGLDLIERHELALVRRLVARIGEGLPGARIVGPSDERRRGAVALAFKGLSPHQLARGLSDGYGICVRSGFHCAQPLHEALGTPATLRASFYLYNSADEVDHFVEALGTLLSLHQVGRRA